MGKPSEYRWVAGFFAAFGMEPHNFYDMTTLGGKSQPIIATAFRSRLQPEHRVFTSLLMTDYFDPETRRQIEELLAPREIFSARAQELILKNESQGGLSGEDSLELIDEAVTRIFKWTGAARNYRLYQELSKAGFKIAADIACFGSHHLNHLTPNTFCMDLYTSAMKFCMGEWTLEIFSRRAQQALENLAANADRDWMKLHFKNLSSRDIDGFSTAQIGEGKIAALVGALAKRLQQPDLALHKLNQSGFKDFTEGPPTDTPVLLRQDSYKALSEPVKFRETDGATVDAVHTARFGEIEERFYATTPKGRKLYDECLATTEKIREAEPDLIKRDYDAYQQAYAKCFAAFPKKLAGLLEQKLVYARYSTTAAGLAAARSQDVRTTSLTELLKLGFAQVEGLRYEDFLPFSAAGIFASNLGQYGTKSTAATRPVYSQTTLENIMGKKIVDPNATYAGLEAQSILHVYGELGLLGKISVETKAELEQNAAFLTRPA
jgi:uncharacterized glyoxalase superfamily metalloenzyme YdcJ